MNEFLQAWVRTELIAAAIAKDCDKFVRGDFPPKGYTTIPVRFARRREVSVQIEGKAEETSKILDGLYQFMVTAWLQDGLINEYVITDLQKLLPYMEHEGRIRSSHKDKWLLFTVNEIQDWGCLVCGEKYPGMPISFRYVVKS